MQCVVQQLPDGHVSGYRVFPGTASYVVSEDKDRVLEISSQQESVKQIWVPLFEVACDTPSPTLAAISLQNQLVSLVKLLRDAVSSLLPDSTQAPNQLVVVLRTTITGILYEDGGSPGVSWFTHMGMLARRVQDSDLVPECPEFFSFELADCGAISDSAPLCAVRALLLPGPYQQVHELDLLPTCR
jgi:hypothetical protein